MEEAEDEEQADGDEDGGDVVVDEAVPPVGIDEFETVETTADVEKDENIGLPTIVALLISRDLPASFAWCLLSS